MDRTIWPSDDEELLEKANILVKELNSAHYYTDMKGLILKCDVLGCDWIGSGEFEGKRHAEKTGHMQLSEIQGNKSQSVLRKCALAGCDFLGQGEASTRKHTSETGHDSYHIIQDV
jgi:ubiquitin thioesterase OTU1